MAADVVKPTCSSKSTTSFAPYRATKLWNDVICAFREGLPVGRHRRQLKTFEDCFGGSEAVTWLHGHLQKNPNFGHQVTRLQTVQLLQKFHKAKVFEDVRSTKQNSYEFTDNGRLFRFTHKSPVKARAPLRAPLATRSALMNADCTVPMPSTIKKADPPQHPPVTCIPHQKLVGRNPEVKGKGLTPPDVELVWRNMILESLRQVLQAHSVEELVDPGIVCAVNIQHNMTHVNKNGIVTNIDKKDQLPHWIISAMRCLAYWPEKVEENLPDYPGFEKDVFKLVKDYFDGLSEPLVTHALYDVFINVMVENLILNMTNQDSAGPDDILIVHDPDVTIYPAPERKSQNLKRSKSSVSMRGPRIETSFGASGHHEPQTRIYPDAESHLYGVHDSGSSDYSRQNHYGDLSRSCDTGYMVHSVDDILERTQDGPAQGRDRFYSMSNVHESAVPENALGPRDRANSWASVQSSMHVLDCPEGRCAAPTGLHLLGGGRRRHQSVSYQPDKKRVDDPYDTFLSEYYRPMDPPPYIPPPSYTTAYTGKPLDALHLPVPGHCIGISRKCGHPTSQSLVDVTCSHQHPRTLTSDTKGSMPTLKHSKSKVSLTESYRQAISNNASLTTPVGRSLFGRRRSSSCSGLLSPVARNRVQEAIQLCCLLLPPANRRKLHLLLRFMNKLSNNDELRLQDKTTTRQLVVDTFYKCVLHSEDEGTFDELLAQQLVSLMMDSYMDVMKVPAELKAQIDDKIRPQRPAKVKYAWDSGAEHANNLMLGNDADLVGTGGHNVPPREGSTGPDEASVTYCVQVSQQEYDQQKMSSSQRAMHDLLEEIVKNKTIADNDKKRWLKEFQKSHPGVYSRRFPTSESEAQLFPNKPRIRPPLLSKPLQRLKSLRL